MHCYKVIKKCKKTLYNFIELKYNSAINQKRITRKRKKEILKMKKIIALVLALAMLLCFAGCGEKSKAKDVKLTIINEELGAEEYGIAYRKGDEQTRDYIDAAVQELVKNGEYAKIAEKYPDIVDNLLFLNGDSDAEFADVDITKAEKRTFIMGIDPEYNPFTYMGDDGEYTGFDIEVCKAACDLLGWDFEVFGVNWDQKLVQLDAKECDCVWSGMTLLDSMTEAGYVLSAPYYYNTQVLVVAEDSGIKSSKDLEGKVVAVQLGTSGESLLNDELSSLKDTFKELVTCDSFLKCFTELEGNAVDAVFVDYPVAKAYVSGK